MKKIKIGQIGIGHNHGEAKMVTVRKFPEIFDIVGIAEPSEEWTKQRGSLAGYEDLRFMSIEELLNTPDLDAIMIETDVKDLMKYAKLCVERGIHVHLDKPAGENFYEYRQIIKTAKKNGAIVQLAYMYRYNPAIQFCLEKVKSGEIGEILSIDAQMSTEHSDSYREWLRQFQGGTMYIFGCHLIDLIVYLQGEPDDVIPFLSKSMKNGIEAIDNTIAVLKYKHGSSIVRVSSVEVNGYTRRQFVICGTKGTIELKPFENPTNMFYTKESSGDIYQTYVNEIPVPEITGRYDEQMLDFARMIQGENDNPFNYDHELLMHKVLLKACDVQINLFSNNF